MHVISVENKEIEIVLGFALKDIYHLYRIMSRAKIDFNTTDEKDFGMDKAVQFLNETFYPFLQETRTNYQTYFARFANDDRISSNK